MVANRTQSNDQAATLTPQQSISAHHDDPVKKYWRQTVLMEGISEIYAWGRE
jgi:hypothetical protein